MNPIWLSALALSAPAADLPDASAAAIERNLKLSKAGIITTASGLGLGTAGTITAAATEDLSPYEAHPAFVTGMVGLGLGWTASAAGPVLLNVGGINAARRLRTHDSEHSLTAAWVGLGGCGAGLLGGWLMAEAYTGSGFALVVAGGGTAVVSGTLQHKRNQSRASRLGVAMERASDRSIQLSLVPRADGLTLAGTF